MSELTAILKCGESDAVEFKESFQEEALQTIGAFANTRGGTLVVGVNDSGKKKPAGRKADQAAGQVTGEVAGEVTSEVTGEVCRLLRSLKATVLGRTDIQAVLGLKGQANFRDRYLLPALKAGLIEMTIPDKPNSRLQRYRLSAKGAAWLKAHGAKP